MDPPRVNVELTRSGVNIMLTPMLTITGADLASLNVSELGALTRQAVRTLATRREVDALSELVVCQADLGRAMGTASMAAAQSVPATTPERHGSQRELTMYAITEAVPGAQWQALFEQVWPAYRSWYLSEGASARPDLTTCTRMLESHMPELVPTWHRLVELTGGDELAARMLTLWDPPRFAPGCSQAVLTEPTPVLVRNYDYSPALFEQVVYSSAFTGRRVVGTGDCLWGLLDGMNDAGIAVSLAFGGRPGSAAGFATPLVLRYLLEVATCTEHAQYLLHDLPVSMAYNLTIVDRSGTTVTAFVAPGQQPEFSDAAVATNHRGRTPELPEHAARYRSVQRQELLLACLRDPISAAQLADRFLQAPLHSTDYEHGFGTLYTAVYDPVNGVVEYRWPGDGWRRTFSSPSEMKSIVLPRGAT